MLYNFAFYTGSTSQDRDMRVEIAQRKQRETLLRDVKEYVQSLVTSVNLDANVEGITVSSSAVGEETPFLWQEKNVDGRNTMEIELEERTCSINAGVVIEESLCGKKNPKKLYNSDKGFNKNIPPYRVEIKTKLAVHEGNIMILLDDLLPEELLEILCYLEIHGNNASNSACAQLKDAIVHKLHFWLLVPSWEMIRYHSGKKIWLLTEDEIIELASNFSRIRSLYAQEISNNIQATDRKLKFQHLVLSVLGSGMLWLTIGNMLAIILLLVLFVGILLIGCFWSGIPTLLGYALGALGALTVGALCLCLALLASIFYITGCLATSLCVGYNNREQERLNNKAMLENDNKKLLIKWELSVEDVRHFETEYAKYMTDLSQNIKCFLALGPSDLAAHKEIIERGCYLLSKIDSPYAGKKIVKAIQSSVRAFIAISLDEAQNDINTANGVTKKINVYVDLFTKLAKQFPRRIKSLEFHRLIAKYEQPILDKFITAICGYAKTELEAKEICKVVGKWLCNGFFELDLQMKYYVLDKIVKQIVLPWQKMCNKEQSTAQKNFIKLVDGIIDKLMRGRTRGSVPGDSMVTIAEYLSIAKSVPKDFIQLVNGIIVRGWPVPGDTNGWSMPGDTMVTIAEYLRIAKPVSEFKRGFGSGCCCRCGCGCCCGCCSSRWDENLPNPQEDENPPNPQEKEDPPSGKLRGVMSVTKIVPERVLFFETAVNPISAPVAEKYYLDDVLKRPVNNIV